MRISKGSLEVGKLADFAVIDRDLMTCPAEYIKDTNLCLPSPEVRRSPQGYLCSHSDVEWPGSVLQQQASCGPGKSGFPLNDIVNGISAEKRTEGSSVLVTLDGKVG